MSDSLKRIVNRFLRAGGAGAITTMIIIAPMNTSSWADFAFWIEALILSGAFGFITGVLMAIDKYLRDQSSSQ